MSASLKRRSTIRSKAAVEAVSHAEPRTCASAALTQLNGHSQQCANPFCNVTRESKPRGKHGRFCSDRCRMDGYVLRRAKEMINRVGIVRFNKLLEEL